MRSSFFGKQVARECRFLRADPGVLFVRVRHVPAPASQHRRPVEDAMVGAAGWSGRGRSGLCWTHAGAKGGSGAVCRSYCDRRAMGAIKKMSEIAKMNIARRELEPAAE